MCLGWLKGKAVFWSSIVSETIILFLFTKNVVSFLWLNLVGTLLTVVIGLIFQKIMNDK